jgi:lipopolysaccharide/colanic/teichoic acid biosynthesis glycosyltransferase
MSALLSRSLDILVSAVGLVVCFPLLLVIGLLIRVGSPGGALFWSRRVGRGGCAFWMLKFRTMVEGPPARANLVTPDDDPRITALGTWLRKHKLDELPQLWNVLRGEMTLVGPRPQAPELVAYYSESERRVLESLPGLTDPASLHFWNEGTLLRGSRDPDNDYLQFIHPAKMRLSLGYLAGRSFVSDLGVLGRTAGVWLGLSQVLSMARSRALTTRS